MSAKSKLSVTNVASIDIVPEAFSLQSTKLSIEVQLSLSIPPQPIYHPAVIEACQIMHGKLPSQLSSEEIKEFKFYQQFKLDNGDPIEEDDAYLPLGGLRTCVQCGNLT